MDQPLISAPEAARRLKLSYHAFLYWVRENLHEIKDHSQKVGHNWVFEESHIEAVKKKILPQE